MTLISLINDIDIHYRSFVVTVSCRPRSVDLGSVALMQISCSFHPLAPGTFFLSCLDVVSKTKTATEPLKLPLAHPLRPPWPLGNRWKWRIYMHQYFKRKGGQMQTTLYIHRQETPLYRSGMSHLSSQQGNNKRLKPKTSKTDKDRVVTRGTRDDIH